MARLVGKFFPVALPREEAGPLWFLSVFLVLSILYYFLRFQFNQPFLFALAQVLALSLLALIAARNLLVGRYALHHALDFVLVLLLLHGVLFCAFVVLRDGMQGAAQAVLATFLPVMVYFFVSNALSPIGAGRLLWVLEAILVLVAVIYIAEFVNIHMLGRGYFAYSDAINEHAQVLAGRETSRGWISGEHSGFYRLAGPLAHWNTTGLALALGLVLSVTRYFSGKALLNVPIVLVFCVALILGGGRTAIIAGLAGSLVATVVIVRKSMHKLLFRLVPVAAVLFTTLVVLVAIEVIDLAAFSVIYGTEQVIQTLEIMGSVREIQDYLQRLQAFPLMLLTGLGPVSPGMPDNDLLSPVPSEDVFFITLLSSYGVLLPFLLGAAVWIVFRDGIAFARRRADPDLQSMPAASLGCIVAYVVSTAHTNASMWPQLAPVFFLFLAILSIVRKSARRDTRP